MTTRAPKRKPVTKQTRSAKQGRYTVFISHSSKDIWIAQQIARSIEESGANYILDKRDFEGGKKIVDEITKGVRESQEVLVLLSPNSKAAKWVIFEVGAASQGRRHLTPILYSVEHKDKDLEIIADLISIDLNNEFDQKYLGDLKKRIVKWRAGRAKKK